MKNNLSVFLSLAMILSIVPMTALAAEIDSYNGIKQHVSDVYGIPLDIVNTLDEAKVRRMDVDDSQVVSAKEEYANFVTDENGDTTVIPSTEEDYLDYINKPATRSNPTTDDNGWMKIYLIIIDNGSTLNISSTYTWLIQPRVTYGQHDLLNITWENGSYIRGSAKGFYSYNVNGITYHSEDLSGFTQSSDNPRSITHAHPMNGSGARRNEFFHMMVTVEKNTGLSREYASSTYGQQYKALNLNLSSLLGGASGIAGAFYISNPYAKAFAVAAAVGSILSNLKTYYDTFSVVADARV